MEPAFPCVSQYIVTLLLLQNVLTSEQFTVSSPRSRQVVLVGRQAELSCQLAPPQRAEHMQVGWYRDHYQPVIIHQQDEERSGESTQNYLNRTEFLKDDLGEGKMTLRINKISVSDEGKYHCFFKDGDTSEEAVVDLKVAAVGVDMQINVQVSDKRELMVECNSGGWFPQAQMEWRDSGGNVIPASSKIFAQDGAGLLDLKMSVVLKKDTHGPVTCCFLNPVTGQEKRASVVLPDTLLKSEYVSTISHTRIWLLIYFMITIFLLFLQLADIKCEIPALFKIILDCLPFSMYASLFPIYWKLWNRTSVLDDLAPLYSTWMGDMSVILTTLMLYFSTLIMFLLYTLTENVDFDTNLHYPVSVDDLEGQTSDYSSETQDT